MRQRIFSLITVIMILSTSLVFAGQMEKHKHKVGISVGIVPLYITDSGGYPVNNIKPQELELKINGKTVPFQFINYSVNLYNKEKAKKTAPKVISSKIHVIILDTLFNTINGVQKSKKMIKKFIRDDGGKHRFLILKLSLLKGLENLTEITDDTETLIAAVENVKPRHSFLNSVKFSSRLLSRKAELTLWDPRDRNGPYNEDLKLERAFYKTATYQYEAMFEKIKYLLSMIKSPKVSFLFSEGISRGSLLEISENPYEGYSANSIIDYTFTESANTSGIYSSRHLTLLQKIAHSLNTAGTILFGINPLGELIEEPMDSGSMALSSMAGMSGGKYFEGSDPSVVFDKIKHTTSAYYELAYSIDNHKHSINSVEVKVKRPGVKINTIKAARGEVKYTDMKDTEKKLFILSLIKGDRSSDMAVTGQKIETDKRSFNMEIAENFRGKKIDIYRVFFFDKGERIDINSETKKVGNKLKVKLDPRSEESFVVLIQPEDSISSIYKIVF